MTSTTPLRIFSLTALAMIAFAANSILARLALTGGDIGPWSFTAIRFISGAVCLALIIGPMKTLRQGSWNAAFALLLYGIFFSYALSLIHI